MVVVTGAGSISRAVVELSNKCIEFIILCRNMIIIRHSAISILSDYMLT